MYKIVITKRAIKDLSNIDSEMKDRIAIKVREYIGGKRNGNHIYIA